MSMIVALPANEPSTNAPDESASPHILLVLDQFSGTLGGGERIILKLAKLLPQHGYRVSIMTFSVHAETPALKAAPCPVYLLPLQRTYDFNALGAALELRRFLKKHQVQLVQTFFESSDLWAGLVTKTVPGVKLIWSRRDMGILRTRKHRIAYRLMARLPDMVFAVSEQVRQYCIEVDGIDPARVTTIYNGLELADWCSTFEPVKTLDHLCVTTLGNIRRVKGHDIFIKAAAAVVPEFPNVSFSIVGEVVDLEYFEDLQKLVNELNLQGHFHFTGGLTNPREYLASSDIFVLPSRSEGFSNAIVEAMAVSLPVIATHVGGNAEAVSHGVTGLIVPSDDPETLSQAIVRLLRNPSEAKQMGAAGKSKVEKLFTIESMMNRIAAAYRKVLSEI